MKLTIPITPELRVRLLHAQSLEIEVPDTTVPEGWQLVPFNPSEEQWDGLARSIVLWMRSYPSNQHTPRTLVEFITSYGHAVPKWMEEESELLAKDHVISKGTVAVLVYKAMLAAATKPEGGDL